MPGCGKTHYLPQQLQTAYSQNFENIFLIFPTYVWNKSYDQDFIHNDLNFVVIPCKQNDVEKYLKFIVNFIKGTDSLIILDDCTSTTPVKNDVGELVKLGFSARHMRNPLSLSPNSLLPLRIHTAKTFPN